MKDLTYKPITPALRGRIKRGNIIKATGTRGPLMVLQADWKKGLHVAPYEGTIASRNLRNSQERDGERRSTRPEYQAAKARWIQPAAVTHYASR